jgi:hypothetical protein
MYILSPESGQAVTFAHFNPCDAMTRNRSPRPVFSQSHTGAAAIGVDEFEGGFFKGRGGSRLAKTMFAAGDDDNGKHARPQVVGF